jgi:hypothetical protein
MANVTKIDWTVRTGDQWWSGSDTQIQMEIYRDNTLLKRLNLEPGNTPRLNRSTEATYYWQFLNPDRIGVSVSGTIVPFTVPFPNGIRGHLRVKLIAKGDDAWEKLWIDSNVYFGELRYVPGTIDSSVWFEDWDSFSFNQDVVLSTDSREGFTTWTLIY